VAQLLYNAFGEEGAMIWNREYETMSREDMRQLQLERLQATLHRVYRSVTFYQGAFDQAGFQPEDLKDLDGLAKLSFTTKAHLRDSYPYGMFAVPLREVVRLHTSSGTAARPTVVGYTANDIAVWTEIVARAMTAAGLSRDDVVQIAFDYGLMTAAFGLHFGAERIGASVIPMSTADAERHIRIMQDYRTTAFVSTPSLALHLGRVMRETGVDRRKLSLRIGLFGTEPWSEERRAEIEVGLGITALDIYGLSEVIGPGVAGECEAKSGLHLFEDHFIPEIVDPVTGSILPEGSEGELVITTISKEACPLIRFRTGDVTRLWYEECSCGRRTVKIGRVFRRTDDRIIIRGINVSPMQVEEILLGIEGAQPRFRLIADSEDGLDYLEVAVEVGQSIFFDQMKRQKTLAEEIKRRIAERLDLDVRVKLVEPKTMGEELRTKPPVEDRRGS
jgi:phenylacetate-CoA ligase